jgi:histidyl-tRNA synthetase
MSKPTLARGTRDFGPEQMVRRNFIFDIIRQTFRRFGFQPLETPSIENLSVLMGKYGEEGDQLLFKILNSGDFASKTTTEDWQAGSRHLLPKITEKGLRYDLTVPFARYVAMNRGTLSFPFKRYQIQPVWRADRPQRGRYREFYQCDADVVGTTSLLCEAEIVMMLHQVLRHLGIEGFTVKINHRKILTGIAEVIGAPGRESTLCVAIDKLDKIGKDGVFDELGRMGFTSEQLDSLTPFISFENTSSDFFPELRKLLATSVTALEGLNDLEQVLTMVSGLGLEAPSIQLDITLARGLSYYTGCIFEVKAHHVRIGSICGGGRYDNLTESFGVKDISGVGISFGVDRIYDVMDELGLFPELYHEGTQVMITNFDPEAAHYGLGVLSRLRQAGCNSEMYPDSGKLKKQLDYADRKNIPYVILIGSKEMETGKLAVKNMKTGQQSELTIDEIITLFITNQ